MRLSSLYSNEEEEEDKDKDKGADVKDDKDSVSAFECSNELQWEDYKKEKLDILKDRHETIDELLDDPLVRKEVGDEEYEKYKAKFNKVRFYRIKGSDLDIEMREILDSQDLLSFIRGDNTFRAV